ncbi:MAG: helix-turn-helix transcriptional regulator, partial [Chitinivibrionales bacterium]|nr:helix-turn-helix transcriptional regulator [Chitinivibrionales bacterium]
MSDTTESEPSSKIESQSEDRVGDILRKERITRRITLETLAKDIKLNAKYIKAIESNQYGDLPANPYIRVYLRSIAKYLSLDAEKILNQYYREAGLVSEKTGATSGGKISISSLEKEKSYLPWVIVIVVIVLLALLSFITNKMGLGGASAPVSKTPEDTMLAGKGPAAKLAGDSAGLDSIPANLRPLPESVVVAPAAAIPAPDSLRLTVKGKKDSVWLQIFTDGKSQKKYIHAGEIKRLA